MAQHSPEQNVTTTESPYGDEDSIVNNKRNAKMPVQNALCVTMRGIQTIRRQPRGMLLRCTEEVFVKYKKDLGLFMSSITASPSEA